MCKMDWLTTIGNSHETEVVNSTYKSENASYSSLLTFFFSFHVPSHRAIVDLDSTEDDETLFLPPPEAVYINDKPTARSFSIIS